MKNRCYQQHRRWRRLCSWSMVWPWCGSQTITKAQSQLIVRSLEWEQHGYFGESVDLLDAFSSGTLCIDGQCYSLFLLSMIIANKAPFPWSDFSPLTFDGLIVSLHRNLSTIEIISFVSDFSPEITFLFQVLLFHIQRMLKAELGVSRGSDRGAR